jgi:hypothetical protein
MAGKCSGPQISPQALLLFGPGNHRVARFIKRLSWAPNDREQFSVRQRFCRDIAAFDCLRRLAVQPVADLLNCL